VTESDGPLLFAGGLYKLRAAGMDPFLLLALLNAPIVRKQMRTKQFTRDVIDTLGKRLFEVYLPIPRDEGLRNHVADLTRRAVTERASLRAAIRDLAVALEGDHVAIEEAAELESEPA
jgi:type I restriction enzyme M protein